jgi:predicted alpha/beta-fold hydrolase
VFRWPWPDKTPSLEANGSATSSRTHFRPLPMLGNADVQTVIGALWQGRPLTGAVEEQHVELSDGDRLAVHVSQADAWQPGDPIAILVHGLGGSHRSGCVQRTARRLLDRGLHVARVDLRGCGRGLTLARRTYNAGCSADVRAVAAALHRDSPRSPLFLVGFSLGGNIVLKLAGEAAAEPVPGLARVAAVAPPIDLEASAALIARPRNRVYELHFLRDLVALANQRRRHFPDEPAVSFPRRLTLRLFDDLYTASRGGFADALDYYRRSSSLPLIPRIPVPTLILAARDDPFVAVEPFEVVKAPAHVETHVVPRGGHLGFLGWDGAGGVRWAEKFVTDWIIAAVNT